jgi:hypothetical protein
MLALHLTAIRCISASKAWIKHKGILLVSLYHPYITLSLQGVLQTSVQERVKLTLVIEKICDILTSYYDCFSAFFKSISCN